MPKGEVLDHTDIKLLDILSHDSDIPIAKIAKQLGTSTAKISRRIRSLEQRKFILGYRALLNYDKLGKPVEMMIFINTHEEMHKGQTSEKIKEDLKKIIPGLTEAMITTGVDDIIIKVRLADIKDSTRIIDKLKTVYGIEEVRSEIIVKEEFI